MKRTLLMLATATTTLLAFAGPSAAECEKVATIVALTANEDPLTDEHVIVYRTFALEDGEVFTVTTANDSMANLAATLLTSQAQVAVTGDAIDCFDVSGDAGELVSLMPE